MTLGDWLNEAISEKAVDNEAFPEDARGDSRLELITARLAKLQRPGADSRRAGRDQDEGDARGDAIEAALASAARRIDGLENAIEAILDMIEHNRAIPAPREAGEGKFPDAPRRTRRSS